MTLPAGRSGRDRAEKGWETMTNFDSCEKGLARSPGNRYNNLHHLFTYGR